MEDHFIKERQRNLDKVILFLKFFFSKVPMLLNLIRILRDSRYFYHILQGLFTTHNSRQTLKKIEKIFFKKRVKLASEFKLNNKEVNRYHELLEDGLIVNPLDLDLEVIKTIKANLSSKLCHDPEKPELGYFTIDKSPEGIARAYYMCEDVAKVAGVIEIANNPIILNYVTAYFGALPSIDYIGCWWSLPSKATSLTQNFHRDIDTLHSLKFFIYLTDVDNESGPHVYIKNSLDKPFETSKDKMHDDIEIESYFESESMLKLKGKAGSSFLADTFAFHKGLTPKKNPRLLLQVIYSLKQTPFGPKRPFLDKDEVDLDSLGKNYRLVNKHIMR